jgi:TPR repeat protein
MESRFPRLIAGFRVASIQIRFIAPLKPPFKSPLDHRAARERLITLEQGKRIEKNRALVGQGSNMARYELATAEGSSLGQGNAPADMFFELGMMYSTGRTVPADLVTAHKWFNIAAMRGHRDAIRLRVEIAAEMSEADVAAAQRAARDWLSAH